MSKGGFKRRKKEEGNGRVCKEEGNVDKGVEAVMNEGKGRDGAGRNAKKGRRIREEKKVGKE